MLGIQPQARARLTRVPAPDLAAQAQDGTSARRKSAILSFVSFIPLLRGALAADPARSLPNHRRATLHREHGYPIGPMMRAATCGAEFHDERFVSPRRPRSGSSEHGTPAATPMTAPTRSEEFQDSHGLLFRRRQPSSVQDAGPGGRIGPHPAVGLTYTSPGLPRSPEARHDTSSAATGTVMGGHGARAKVGQMTSYALPSAHHAAPSARSRHVRRTPAMRVPPRASSAAAPVGRPISAPSMPDRRSD